MIAPIADIRLTGLGLIASVAVVFVVVLAGGPLRVEPKQLRPRWMALSLLSLAAALAGAGWHGVNLAFGIIVALELIGAGAYLLWRARNRGTPALPTWPARAVVAAVVVAPVVAAVLSGGTHAKATAGPLSHVGVKPMPGFGPPRPVFRCTRPTECDGPKYVVFDSYENNPKIDDERPFLAFSTTAQPHHAISDSLYISGRATELTLRAFIDNNTYQRVEGLPTTDALDTHLRLTLPEEPVYETNPTLYLYASNARPKTIWDTVLLRSRRPVRLVFVPGSAKLYRRGANGKFSTSRLTGNLAKGSGIDLGRWRADFVHSGFVTFRVRATALPEPVRNPLATRAVGYGRVFYPPPANKGLAKEPAIDGESGEQFPCARTRCSGPPYPALDAYENQPRLGDEADFLRAAPGTEYGNNGNEVYRTVAVVQPGDRLKIRLAIDNSADPEAIGAPPLARLVARDIRAHVLIPSEPGRELRIVGFVHGSNTQPRSISDTLPVRSRQDIRLEPEPRTLAVLTPSGLRRLPPTLFMAKHQPIKIAKALTPSFSKVLYIEFYVRVEPAR